MCGLIGYIGKSLDLDAFRKTALATEAARGGHAFGFAWIDPKNRLRMFKASGALRDQPHALDLAWDAKMLVAHVRWATNGNAAYSCNNHPHSCDTGWLVHNGTLPMHRALAAYWGVAQTGFCDSEVLAGLVEVAPETGLARRLAWALAAGRQDAPQAALGLWTRPGRMLAARAGKPLHWMRFHGGTYLASDAAHLPPGTVHSFADNRVYTIGEDGNVRETAKIGPHAPGQLQGVGRGEGDAGKGSRGKRNKPNPTGSAGARLFPENENV
jgi:glucosamine 6-phosphate synthetase-like amidotransferase/phosphosugar isomerase protein